MEKVNAHPQPFPKGRELINSTKINTKTYYNTFKKYLAKDL